MIDLQFNYPILLEQERMFADALRRAADQAASLLPVPPYIGDERYRAFAAEWLSKTTKGLTAARVAVCSGGHNAIMCALLAARLQDQKIAADPLTYPGFRAQAQALGIELIACEGDRDGMLPQAVSEAAAKGARAIYLMPNVHNPLGTVMPLERRNELVARAREHDLLIVDDDAYGFLEPSPPPHFAMLAPERSFYVWSLTKSFAPALKVAFMIMPEHFASEVGEMLRATSSGAPSALVQVAADIMRSGELEDVIRQKRTDASRKQEMAKRILRGIQIVSHPSSYHVWIPLPDGQRADAIAGTLMQNGVLVSSSSGYLANQSVKANGMRVALGAVRSEETLREGLERVRDVLVDWKGAEAARSL